MSLQMGFTKKLELRTEKVKCVDIHPMEPWVASAMYNGSCTIYNYVTQSLVKRIDICDVPLRTCKFVAHKQWILAAGDKMCIWVYNYNSLEKLNIVEGHKDYVRSLDVHSTLPYVISSSDDMSIILWNIDKNWEKVAIYEGHSHYVMMVKWNPKDMHLFASCSLDRTIMFWGLQESSTEQPKSFFTLTGHERGVNCIDFTTNPSYPYIISGSDDCTIRVWDYQTKLCFQVLKQHIKGVTNVLYHPRLPFILSCSEDGDFNIWNANLYKIKRSINYGYGKLWSISSSSVDTAIASDSGTCVIQLAGDKPLVSMHTNKLVMVKSSDIMSCNLNSIDPKSIIPGQPLSLSFRNIGSCEFFPQNVSYHPNGRFICLYGDSEFIIYTSQGMKSKCFGKASQLVWSFEGDYATYDGIELSLYHDFVVRDVMKLDGPIVRLFGGYLLSICNENSISFYDWSTLTLLNTIDDIHVEGLWWNESSKKLSISTPTSCFILKYNINNNEDESKLFILEKEIIDRITSGIWAMDTFIYINSSLHLNLYICGVIETLIYLDRPLYIIGYSIETSLLYLSDDNICCYILDYNYLKFHSLIYNEYNDNELQLYLNKLSQNLKEKASKLLESLGKYNLSLYCTNDQDRQFELYLKLGNINKCISILSSNDNSSNNYNNITIKKWKILGNHALNNNDYHNATICFKKSNDFTNLLLIYTITGDVEGMRLLGRDSKKNGVLNISFMCYYMLNEIEECINMLHLMGRHSEATIMARCYKPSIVGKSFETWKHNFKSNLNELLPVTIDEQTLNLENLLNERLNTLGFPKSTDYKEYKDILHVDYKNLQDQTQIKQTWNAGL